MRVLIAGHSLSEIGGVQRYEHELASWLLAHGHSPVVFATELGTASRQLDALTIPVVDDLRTLTAPIDIIHGDSAVETMAALLHFPKTPAIFVCHGWEDSRHLAPSFPRILRYIAVDDTCADRLLTRDGIASDNVSVLLNGVDLAAFRQRTPLPPAPRRAVVFGNLAHELTFLPPIRQACRRAGIELDVIGAATDTDVTHPELLLGGYDLAFAKAKCAIEAMACGLAVILCSEAGIGGIVRSADFDRLRRLNFGIRALQKPLSAETILGELALYDPEDARAVSDRIRQTASADDVHSALFSTYEAVIAEHSALTTPPDPVAESRAAALFLQKLAIRDRQRSRTTWTLAKASHRILRMPVIGTIATRALRRMMRR
jgi:glycosyltransferase involved in cell wall biosynthesis